MWRGHGFWNSVIAAMARSELPELRQQQRRQPRTFRPSPDHGICGRGRYLVQRLRLSLPGATVNS